MQKPRISFVVPVYNKEAYISECIKSLQGQTLKDIEIIVVDDASTDDSLQIVLWYAQRDKRIKVIKLGENKGRSNARNVGNNEAKSNIICVQDADDLSYCERAKIVDKFFKNNKGKDVFYSAFYVSDMYGKVIDQVKAVPFDFQSVKKDRVTYIGHSTMAYKKDIVNKIKYSDGKYSSLGIDDWKLQLDLYKEGYQFGYDVRPLVIYRQLSSSITAIRLATEVYKAKGQYLKQYESAISS